MLFFSSFPLSLLNIHTLSLRMYMPKYGCKNCCCLQFPRNGIHHRFAEVNDARKKDLKHHLSFNIFLLYFSPCSFFFFTRFHKYIHKSAIKKKRKRKKKKGKRQQTCVCMWCVHTHTQTHTILLHVTVNNSLFPIQYYPPYSIWLCIFPFLVV